MIIVVELKDGSRQIIPDVNNIYTLNPIRIVPKSMEAQSAKLLKIMGRPKKRAVGVKCPRCGEEECVSAGYRWRCQNCHRWFPKIREMKKDSD
jgi:ribosomal protein S27E